MRKVDADFVRALFLNDDTCSHQSQSACAQIVGRGRLPTPSADTERQRRTLPTAFSASGVKTHGFTPAWKDCFRRNDVDASRAEGEGIYSPYPITTPTPQPAPPADCFELSFRGGILLSPSCPNGVAVSHRSAVERLSRARGFTKCYLESLSQRNDGR